MKKAVCMGCNTGFYFHGDVKMAGGCPFCGSRQFETTFSNMMTLLADIEKELFIPFSANKRKINRTLRRFSWEMTLFERDTYFKQVQGRLRPYYLPIWLADLEVEAAWSAELSFEYEGVTAEEKLSGWEWQSKEVKTPLYRWDAVEGQLKKAFHNVPSIAIEQFRHAWRDFLKNVDVSKAIPFQSASLQDVVVCTPNIYDNRSIHVFQNRVTQACQDAIVYAADARGIRFFQWLPTFSEPHLTQLLFPVYVTYVLDKADKKQFLFIDGRTGKMINTSSLSLEEAKYQRMVIWPGRILLLGLLLLILGTFFGGNNPAFALCSTLFILLMLLWVIVAGKKYEL